MTFKKLLLLWFVMGLPFLSACLGTSKRIMVQPVDGPAFSSAAQAVQFIMIEEGILDKDGGWRAPRHAADSVSSAYSNAGERLLHTLSSGFRGGGVAQAPASLTIGQTLDPEASVTVMPYSFTAVQGNETLHGSLLAVLENNGDAGDDWLVLFRVRTMPEPADTRDYYLLIVEPEAPVLQPRILAIQDCRGSVCQVFRDGAQSDQLMDGNTVHSIVGEMEVLAPPAP